jgi:hypothetical protein
MDFSSIIKKGAPSVEPHELTVITKLDDPLYDGRIHLPVKDEAVLNFAAAGQVQPVAVRSRGYDELVIVDGLQRWKRATIINHLVGRHTYRGGLPAIDEAVARLKDSDIGRRIVELAGGGMKLYVSIFRAGDNESLRAKASANVWREDDAIAEQIRKAHQLARHGFSPADISETLGKSVKTIERYLAADPDKPKQKKKRGKAARPSVKRIHAIHDRASEESDIGWALGLVLGKVSEDDFYRNFPDLKPSKKRKAA